ncbi:MAG: hypothetical protein MI974_00380 [Chitinophagales bacterium]|nr:hypothetical protein [Chitinophagales bacterium]
MKSFFRIAFYSCIGLSLLSCGADTAEQNTEQLVADSITTTEVVVQETLNAEQQALKSQLEGLEQRLNEKVASLSAARDTAITAEIPELEGKIKKLQVREKQLAQHLKKFEAEMNGDLADLNERFKALANSIEADLEAME